MKDEKMVTVTVTPRSDKQEIERLRWIIDDLRRINRVQEIRFWIISGLWVFSILIFGGKW